MCLKIHEKSRKKTWSYTKTLSLMFVFSFVAISGLLPFKAHATATTLNVSIQSLVTLCNDGLDNDGDTLIDYPADPGCTSALDNDETDAVSPPPGPGGGWGGGVLPKNIVNFSGKAYPERPVFLLKDAQLAAKDVADSDAYFEMEISDLSDGNYIFGLYSIDKYGKSSSLFTFPLGVSSGVIISVSDIFISPTIDTDKAEVKKGEDITIFGQSAPEAEITIMLNSEDGLFLQTLSSISGQDGIYLYDLNTLLLGYGTYNVKARAAIGDQFVSDFGRTASFKVGEETIIEEPERCPKADLNGDCLVNLIDFSILVYWLDRFDPPSRIDLSKDGKIDLVDFSIMAYYWTG